MIHCIICEELVKGSFFLKAVWLPVHVVMICLFSQIVKSAVYCIPNLLRLPRPSQTNPRFCSVGSRIQNLCLNGKSLLSHRWFSLKKVVNTQCGKYVKVLGCVWLEWQMIKQLNAHFVCRLMCIYWIIMVLIFVIFIVCDEPINSNLFNSSILHQSFITSLNP